jgi:hypothetical protein
MPARRSMLAPVALVAAVIIGACNATPPPNTPDPNANVATTSPSTAAVIASPTPTPTATPSPTPTATPPSPTTAPAPTPKPKPVAWRTFISHRWHFSIKYPPGWIATRSASSRLPDEFDDYGIFGSHAVDVTRDVVSGRASVSLTVTHDVAYYKSHYKAQLRSNTKVVVAGWSGRLLTFRGTFDGRALFMQHLLLAKGRVGYIIDMWSDRGHEAADKVLFRKMYTTFKPRS